jgi:predicted dehydrogenase
MTNRLKVGVIGLGVGERHAAAFAAHPECELTAICDSDPAKLDDVVSRFPAAARYASADKLIDSGIDVVAVASYDDAHAGQIVRALDNGLHVFAEKPLCTSAEQLAEIKAALKRNPMLRMSSNTLLRNSPRFQDVQARIDSGAMGRIYCIEADYLYGRFHKIVSGWRGNIPGYSVMLGGGIHMVDLVLWLCGERPSEVMATGNGVVSQGTKFEGPDCVMALLTFPSGLIAKVGANFGCVHPHFHRIAVWGTKATFENSLSSPQKSATLWQSVEPAIEPLRLSTGYPAVDKGVLIPRFIDAVLGRGEPAINEDEVFAAVSVCLAIDAAQKSGHRTTVFYN